MQRITPERCIEWFVVSNVAFLGFDILVAHAENRFERRAEWLPIGFSLLATLLLVPMALGARARIWHVAELVVGGAAVLVGISGMILHLQSAFFAEQTLRNLVYSAPFVAPLSYIGVGLVLLLLRMESPTSPLFGPWVVLLAFGGFVGNFGLSLLDHAQNGFFESTEWIPVIAAAFGGSFLLVALAMPEKRMIRITFAVLGAEVVVGLLGFALHVVADVHGRAMALSDRFVFGAPAFAPLLFADLAALAGLGLWAMARNDSLIGHVDA